MFMIDCLVNETGCRTTLETRLGVSAHERCLQRGRKTHVASEWLHSLGWGPGMDMKEEAI